MFLIKAEDIIIENPYSIEAYKSIIDGEDVSVLRHTIKDVAASFRIADFVSEIQIKKTRFYDERAIYYPFDRFCKNYSKEGFMQIGTDGKPNRFSSLKPVYALNILGYSHFTDDEALRIFELYDPKRKKAFNKKLIHIGFFELSKTNIETPNQKHWHDYFTTGKVSEDAPEYIKKASRLIEFVNLREEEKTVALALEKAQAIYDADMSDAYHDGKDDGIAEGMEKGREEGIKKGMEETIKKIAKETGLNLEKLQEMVYKEVFQ
jgi:predicted transposase/invertase (TIGR01784 family)